MAEPKSRPLRVEGRSRGSGDSPNETSLTCLPGPTTLADARCPVSIRDAGTSLHAASTSSKIQWRGTVSSVQPRIRLTRSFDQRSHSYQGYVLRVSGSIAGETREFLVAVGPAAHAKHQFRTGASVNGEGIPVAEPRLETAEIYRVSKLKVVARGPSRPAKQPPWQGVPPELPVYREHGHRRLGLANVREGLRVLHLGMQDGGRDDRRPVEPEPAAPPHGDVLLRPALVPRLPGWTDAQSPWAPRDDIRGGAVGRRRRYITSGSR